jgi:hypothetical protein
MFNRILLSLFEDLKSIGIDPEWMDYLIAKWIQSPLGQINNRLKEKYLTIILEENKIIQKIRTLPVHIIEQFVKEVCERSKEMIKMNQCEHIVEQYEIRQSYLKHFDDTGERDVSDDTIKELLSFTHKTEELVPSMLRRYRDYYKSVIPKETSVEDDRTIDLNSADNAYIIDRLTDYNDKTKSSTIELDILLKMFEDEVTGEVIERFSNKQFWPISRQYQKNDVLITCEALNHLDKLYRESFGVSVVDVVGLASASFF